MASLYDRIASTPDGAKHLAAARLRREALKILHSALAAAGINQVQLAKRLKVRKSAVNQVLNGDGNLRMTTLAEYLFAADHEVQLTLVPAGQPRRDVLARREAFARARHEYPSPQLLASSAGTGDLGAWSRSGGVLLSPVGRWTSTSSASVPARAVTLRDPNAGAWHSLPISHDAVARRHEVRSR